MTDNRNPFLLPSREKEVKRAVEVLSSRDVTLAYLGLHQMGKRCFVDRIGEELRSKGLPVVSVCVDENIEVTFFNMCRQFRQCGVELDDEIKESAPDPIYGYIAMLEASLDSRADKSGNRIILILRDFDRFAAGDSILKGLLNFFDDPKRYGISIILIMTKALEMIVNRETAKVTEVPGRFYSENRRQIKPYMEKEVLEWCKDLGMGEEDRRKVWHLSCGHPYLMKEAETCFEGKPRKGWVDRFNRKAEEYYSRLEEFLLKIRIDPGMNPQVHTLLDAVIRIGRFGEQVSKTAENFLSDYGLLIDGQIACSEVFWEILRRDGKMIDAKSESIAGEASKKARRSGGISKYHGSTIRTKSIEHDAIIISTDGQRITLGGDVCRVTNQGVWDFIDDLLKAEKKNPGGGWWTATGDDSAMFRGTEDLVRLKNWIIFESEPGSKRICKARFKKYKSEMVDRK